MRILGVDPGATGAVALITDDIGLVSIDDMPSLSVRRGKSDKLEVNGSALARYLSVLAPDVAYIEAVGGMQGQSASAAFNFGRACGAPEYICAALRIPVVRVSPGRWKRAMGLKGGKDESRMLATRMWPAHARLFERKKDNDRAEAALLAEYGRRLEIERERSTAAACGRFEGASDGIFE